MLLGGLEARVADRLRDLNDLDTGVERTGTFVAGGHDHAHIGMRR